MCMQVKKYGALFIWGQLSGWFKQTVYDPTASLSAERRGTLSLPDVDSCYNSLRQYTVKVLILTTPANVLGHQLQAIQEQALLQQAAMSLLGLLF